MTLPGDTRLVGAVKGLSAHAAGYAQLEDSAREGFAGQVAAATEAAMAAAPGASAPIDLRFTGDEEALTVVISCEAGASRPRPRSATADDVTVDWATEGSRHVCHIRQPISA
ncbi:MAG TPA: hypothetical protein VMO26_04630 [Vicinamibacterales bacterium]|nr:hypothetical protein [Vicinamibacterales bacterium]